MSQAAVDKIKELNHAYHMITGENAYLYAQASRITFNTAPRPFTNTGDALAHMSEVLEKARSGWTHDEIMYGKQRPMGPVASPHPENKRHLW